MRKLLSLTLILALSLTTFIGVAAAEADKGEPNVTIDSVFYDDWSIEITWLPQYGFDTDNIAMGEYLIGTAVAFVKDHPEVKVTCAAQSVNIADAMGKVLTQAASGNAPDLVSVDSFYLPLYYDYLQPITDVFEENGLSLGSWFPFAQQLMVNKDGEVAAMWYDTDVRVLFYQKNLIPTAPATWDELFEIMRPLKDEGYMFLYPAGANETTSCDIWPWFWSQGGQILDGEGNPVFAQGDNYDKLVSTLAFLQKTVATGITPTRVTSYMTDAEMNTDIMTGKVACFVAGSWVGRQLATLMGSEEFEKNWGIAAIPVAAGATKSTCCGGWTAGVLSKDDTKRKLAAELGIRAFISREGMLQYCDIKGNLPCRTDLYDDERFASDWQAVKFCEMLVDGNVRPGYEIYTYISKDFQNAIANVISGDQTPEDAVKAMKENVELY